MYPQLAVFLSASLYLMIENPDSETQLSAPLISQEL